MALTLTLANINISNNRVYDDFDLYISNKIASGNRIVFDNVVFKEETSILNPTFVISTPPVNTNKILHFNYAMLYVPDVQTTSGITRFYLVKEIRFRVGSQMEIDCEFDALRNYDITACYGKLAYSDYKNNWVKTIDDMRFEPYNMQRYNGVTSKTVGTNLTSISNGSDFYANGVVVMKFWYGVHTQNSDIGICCAAMDLATFQQVIALVANYITNNIGTVLSGITDFTKFIYSAKFYPSLRVVDMIDAGYTFVEAGFVIGGLCSIQIPSYLRFNTAGMLDGGNQSFEINILNLVENKHEMKFLAKERWCDVVIETPIGWKTVPMNMLSSYNDMVSRSIIDFETGELKIGIYKHAGTTLDPHSEHVLDISGSCSIDVTDQIVHIASLGEKAVQTVPKAAVGYILGGPAGAALGTLTGALTAGTEINQRGESNNGSMQAFKIFNWSLKVYRVNTYLYLNPDSIINDTNTYSPLDAWDANAIQAAYNTFCASYKTGYPSNKWGTVGSFLKAGSTTGVDTMLKFSEVSAISVVTMANPMTGMNALLVPEHEEAIRKALLEGIVYKHYSNV